MATNSEKPAAKRARRSSKRAADTSAASSGGASSAAQAPPRVEDVGVAAAGAPPRLGSIGWLGGVRSNDVTVFLRQLIMLLEAGTPILKSLETLARRSESPGIRRLVNDITQFVEMGNPLWRAFERHPRYFDTVFVNLVRASEASGTLITVLRRLVEYRERVAILKRRMKSAMIYPSLLLVVCLGVVFLISRFLIPQFEDLFAQMDVELPGYTQRFMAVTNFIGAYWWVIIGLIAAVVIVYKLACRDPRIRLRADAIKVKIPILGPLYRNQAIVQFCRSLSLLLGSGLSMMVTLDLVRRALVNQAFAHMTRQLADSVERGEGMERPLREHANLMPPVVTDMLVTGEESGSLDSVADQVATSYEEELNVRVNTLSDMLVPVLTVIIAVLVGFLAFAMLSPIIQLIDQLQAGGGGA